MASINNINTFEEKTIQDQDQEKVQDQEKDEVIKKIIIPRKDNMLLPEYVYQVDFEGVNVVLLGEYHSDDNTQPLYTDLIMDVTKIVTDKTNIPTIVCEANLLKEECKHNPLERNNIFSYPPDCKYATLQNSTELPINLKVVIPDEILRSSFFIPIKFFNATGIDEKTTGRDVLEHVTSLYYYCLNTVESILDVGDAFTELGIKNIRDVPDTDYFHPVLKNIVIKALDNYKGYTSLIMDIKIRDEIYSNVMVFLDKALKDVTNFLNENLDKPIKNNLSEFNNLRNNIRYLTSPLFDVPCLIEIYAAKYGYDTNIKNGICSKKPNVLVFSGLFHTQFLMYFLLNMKPLNINAFVHIEVKAMNNLIWEGVGTNKCDIIFSPTMSKEDLLGALGLAMKVKGVECLTMGGDRNLNVSIIFGILIFLIIVLIIHIITIIYQEIIYKVTYY